MTTRFRRLVAGAAFTLALASMPTSGLAYPLTTSTSTQSQSGANPLRTLLALMSYEADALWSALNAVYSDSYIGTSGCDLPC